MHDFTVWVSYGKWRKNWDIRYCLLHLIHLSSTRLRRCGRILSGICEPFCLITPDLTMRYCPIFILIDYNRLFLQRSHIINPLPTTHPTTANLKQSKRSSENVGQSCLSVFRRPCVYGFIIRPAMQYPLPRSFVLPNGSAGSGGFVLRRGLPPSPSRRRRRHRLAA